MNEHNEPDITDLANQWISAKAREESANRDRVRIEQAMLPFLKQKPEGASTTELPAGHKITVSNKINRTIDLQGFATVREQIPANLRPIKTKEVLDEQGVKYLAENEPAIFQLIAPYLTSKPAKPGVKVVGPVQEVA